jgi:capsular exopolysaccharide synthesis family protein
MQNNNGQTKINSIKDFLFILFYKKYVLIGVMATIVVVTVGLSLLISPIYEVTARVLIRPFVDSNVQYQVPQSNFKVVPVSQEDINSEIEILKSDELLRNVVKKLNLHIYVEPDKIIPKYLSRVKRSIKSAMVSMGLSEKNDPVDVAVEKLSEDLSIEPITLSNMIGISLKGDDPALITKIVNNLIDSYIDRHIAVHRAKGSKDFFSRQARLYFEKLRLSENELRELEKKWSVSDLENQKNSNAKLLVTLHEKLAAIRADKAESETKFEKLQKSMNDTGDLSATTKEFRESAVITELMKSLVPILTEKERIAQLYPETSHKYRDVTYRINEINSKIKQELQRILYGAKLDLEALSNQEKSIVNEIHEAMAESVALSDKEVKLNELQRAVEHNKKNYLLYREKTEEARIEEQKESERVANVSVASWAQKPSIPVFPHKAFLGVLSLIVGLIAGMGGAVVSYYMDNRLKKPEDVTKLCDLAVPMTLGIVKSQKIHNGKPTKAELEEEPAHLQYNKEPQPLIRQLRGQSQGKPQNDAEHDLASLFGLDSYPMTKEATESDNSEDLELVSVFKNDYNEAGTTTKNSNEKDASSDPKPSEFNSIQLPPPPHSRDNNAPKLWLWNPADFQNVLENFRSLKSQIVNVHQTQDLKTFLFTGAEKGAGSSVMAFNFALALAWDLIEKKILLIDANLSDPRLHDSFGLTEAPGLVEYITGELPLEKVIRTTHWPNLHLLTAGRCENWMSSPFDLEEFDYALKGIRDLYDFIIIDSATIYNSNQTRSISSKVDGVIIVAEASRTRWHLLFTIKNQLEQDGARTLGAIFNKRRYAIPDALYKYL